ncbi:DoxX family protein [Sphingomonas sp. SUN019]|uniref:DoxX family protein n=1 Tax=Sphingomonas sp. SUN019 TaxID=2937788 RepID=UPI0021642559|nr:DoxX family protein [Sphingomonas sp. SUN019]UVO49322.1 DoxX family protein [Sphingomonas sp. SUN019]
MRGDGRGRAVARWLLIAFYGVAGVAHLIVTDAMVAIVPRLVPFPREIVILTGLCEMAGAIGLMTMRWRVAAGWGLAAYALCVWPANMQHAIHDLGAGTGLSIWYHAPRLALQPVIIWWALWASGAIDWPWRSQHDANPRGERGQREI